ncbi:MAG TPA: DinB family protein [Anaerolineae bacterium]|nr:DinB family protein [Anaerolineae bacterium]
MNSNELLLDLIDENVGWVHWLLGEVSEDCLYWYADEGGNNIAVTLWHVTRVFDLFYTQHILNESWEKERWWASGWAERSGYDPQGVGVHGWGTLQGYTRAEVEAIPPLGKEILQGYFDEVLGMIRGYVAELEEDEWRAMAPGFEGKQSNYFWIRAPFLDMVRHIGEMVALKDMWMRVER